MANSYLGHFTELSLCQSGGASSVGTMSKRKVSTTAPSNSYQTLSGPFSSFTGNLVCIVRGYGKGVSEQYLLCFMSSLSYVLWLSSIITHAQQEGNSSPDAPLAHLSQTLTIHIRYYTTRAFHF